MHDHSLLLDELHFTQADLQYLRHLRDLKPARATPSSSASKGEQIADRVAAIVGSWRFIIIQSSLLMIWIGLNVTILIKHWDPYPFILLNLALSFQAAYATPFILMSQNRQSDIDRAKAKQDLDCDIKAEMEIELLHHKLDILREREIAELRTTMQEQYIIIQRLEMLISVNHDTNNPEALNV